MSISIDDAESDAVYSTALYTLRQGGREVDWRELRYDGIAAPVKYLREKEDKCEQTNKSPSASDRLYHHFSKPFTKPSWV